MILKNTRIQLRSLLCDNNPVLLHFVSSKSEKNIKYWNIQDLIIDNILSDC